MEHPANASGQDASDHDASEVELDPSAPAAPEAAPQPEFGGRDGPEATRYGDWEKNGRCIDF